MKILPYILLMFVLMSSCVKTGDTSARTSGSSKPVVSVSLPVEAYFVERLVGDNLDINILVPQSAGHSDYSPLPSQMMELSRSQMYLAIGELDFELSWKERMQNANKDMRWVNLDDGIDIISEENHHHHDPHYWLSPKQVRLMVGNMAKALKEITEANVDSAADVLLNEIAEYDEAFGKVGSSSKVTFMIYHPALSYLASDYGMEQLEIEKDGNAPAPQAYMSQIEKAKVLGASIVFVQQGYDMQKAQSAADMIGAKVVEFNPEGKDWPQTMNVILDAMQK